MTTQTSRALAVRQALARRARTTYTAPELQVLTRYVLGYVSLEHANAELRALGLTLSLAQASGPLA